MQGVAGTGRTLAASVIKSGVFGVCSGEQRESLADDAVELGLSVHGDSGAWTQARASNGRAKD